VSSLFRNEIGATTFLKPRAMYNFSIELKQSINEIPYEIDGMKEGICYGKETVASR